MSDRITEDNFGIITLSEKKELTIEKDGMTALKLKQRILSNQIKSDKYDDLMNANHEIVQTNISHTKIFQENKQHKESLLAQAEIIGEYRDKMITYEVKLERIKKLGLTDTIETLINIMSHSIHPSCGDDIDFLKESKKKHEQFKEILKDDNVPEMGTFFPSVQET